MGAHILEIVIMLLIAAILGFLIAWFWKKRNTGQDEIENYKKQISEKEKELERCKQKISELEASAHNEQESEDEIALKRIKEKAKDINFERIGTASEEEKDDLKVISGIGPFIEKKLNILGIYTYRQIANFTEEDREKVNEAIEFFPGRIMRDDWIGQAKKLMKQ